MACTTCCENTSSFFHSGNVCYLGRQRWLAWKNQWYSEPKALDGKTEFRPRPKEWSGNEILSQLNSLLFQGRTEAIGINTLDENEYIL